MNVTVSLDEDVVKRVREIAVERDTTVTGLVREYLTNLALTGSVGRRKSRERRALERSFEKHQFKIGKRTWNRANLHARA